MVRTLLIVVAIAIASGCSQRVAATPPIQITTPTEAEQAIDYLAWTIERNDYQAGLSVFSERFGSAGDGMAALLAASNDAPSWLRSRVLVTETPTFFVYELAAVGELRTHTIRVHKQSTSGDGVRDEGIEL